MTRSAPSSSRESFTRRARVGRRGAAALVQPADEIAFEDASPARREFNDGRSFAERDQTLERTASEAGDRGGLIVGVDGERGLPAPRCGVTAFVPRQAGRTSRQDAHPPVGMRNDMCLGRRVSQTLKPPSCRTRSPFVSERFGPQLLASEAFRPSRNSDTNLASVRTVGGAASSSFHRVLISTATSSSEGSGSSE